MRKRERKYCSKAILGGRKGKNGGADAVCNSCKRNGLIAMVDAKNNNGPEENKDSNLLGSHFYYFLSIFFPFFYEHL